MNVSFFCQLYGLMQALWPWNSLPTLTSFTLTGQNGNGSEMFDVLCSGQILQHGWHSQILEFFFTGYLSDKIINNDHHRCHQRIPGQRTQIQRTIEEMFGICFVCRSKQVRLVRVNTQLQKCVTWVLDYCSQSLFNSEMKLNDETQVKMLDKIGHSKMRLHNLGAWSLGSTVPKGTKLQLKGKEFSVRQD